MSGNERNRAALKALRERQGPALAETQARLKEQTRIVNDLTRLLEAGPKTVLDLAREAGLPTQTVFWHLIALKKYGKVVEGEQEGDYYQYRLSEQ
ncbi:MAG: winged helix-turn-helix domain-containing protein [Dehalococcoidales bacterium]|nr:winged helix-turn-helix domain-containing protein [Dehalococcoidales bacterium]